MVQPVFERFKDELNKSGADGGKVLADVEAMIKKYAK